MFNFNINNFNAFITVELTDGDPGPKTTMYYPRNAEVVLGDDTFTIDGKLFTPVLEDSRIGHNDIIRIYS